METQIITLPAEVNELAVRVSANKQEEVQNVLQQIFTGTDDWEKQVDAIEVKGVDDKMSIELAEVARKNAKTARLSAEKLIDAKRDLVQNEKLQFDLEDKLWLKTKQVMQIKFKAIEEKAEWKANYVKRFDAEQKELRTQKRINEVQKFAEINRIEFESMSDDSFDTFLSGLKTTYEAKVELERKAEEERITKEKEDKLYFERFSIVSKYADYSTNIVDINSFEWGKISDIDFVDINNKLILAKAKYDEEQAKIKAENEKLKLEAQAKEKQLADERAKAEAERKAMEAKAAKLKADADAKLKAEKEANEKLQAEIRAKSESEAKAKRDAEIKAEAELKAKQQAEIKAVKAPIKQQLNTWVDSFSLGKPLTENDITTEIEAKFEAFRTWAKTQIEKM